MSHAITQWIAEQRKLESGATKGPWVVDGEAYIPYDETVAGRIINKQDALVLSEADAALIATSRNNYAKLLDAVEALSATLQDIIEVEQAINPERVSELMADCQTGLMTVGALLCGEEE